MSNIGAIILSRYSSSRLPGKALMKINEKPVLQYIVERLETVLSKNQIVIATSDEQSDDLIAEFAKSIGINCFRGSLNNVSERFLCAALDNNFDYAIRINGDNIFVDTELLNEMMLKTLKEKPLFLSNVKNRTYPKGMSIEIVRTSHYADLIDSISTSASYKEHVTLYLYENEADNYKFVYNTTYPEIAGVQMALDTAEDFKRCEFIISKFTNPHETYTMPQIIEFLKEYKNE